MEVEVGIETHGPPTDERVETLKSAAARFADNPASISVTHTEKPDRHTLVTRFTMRTTAQYKVIDDIGQGFKMDIWILMITWICGLPFRNPRRSLGKDAAHGD